MEHAHCVEYCCAAVAPKESRKLQVRENRTDLSCLVLCTGQHSNGVKWSGVGRMV